MTVRALLLVLGDRLDSPERGDETLFKTEVTLGGCERWGTVDEQVIFKVRCSKNDS